MDYSNSNISIGFDTFDRDSSLYYCTNANNSISAAVTTANDNWNASMNSICSANDHLQDQIDMLKLQISKLGQSSEKAGSAMKKFMDKLAKKPSIRSELSTLTAWQTI